MKQHYTDIDGWCEDEVEHIVELAISQSNNGAVFVEVGTFLGRSTALIYDKIASSGKNITFYTVDDWGSDPMYLPTGVYDPVETEDGFYSNMGSRTGSLSVLKMDTLVAADEFLNESIDFLFLDDNHDYSHVVSEINGWLPKIKTGGIIAGHDYNMISVSSAVNTALAGNNITIISGSNVYRHGNWDWRFTSWYTTK